MTGIAQGQATRQRDRASDVVKKIRGTSEEEIEQAAHGRQKTLMQLMILAAKAGVQKCEGHLWYTTVNDFAKGLMVELDMGMK